MQDKSEQFQSNSGTGERKAPPAKTRLYWSWLTNNEKSVLDAMYEHSWDGSTVWASLPRLAAYCKLSRKTVQRVLHGDSRKGQRHAGLIDRGIVTQLAKANRGKKRPAIYQINADALTDDPQMEQYKRRRGVLPGIYRRAVPGEPIEAAATDPRSIVPPLNHGPTVPGTTDPRSTDSLEPNSLSKPLTHHADGAMTMPAWRAIKEQLRSELSSQEWDLWVRPARLFRMMDDKTMLIAVPHSGEIMAAATARKGLLNEIASHAGLRAVLTRYPDEWERDELKRRFGIDLKKA